MGSGLSARDGQIRRDDERYRRLAAAGWRVIRLSAADLRDMASVVARIAAALAA
jgi:very-short-patch-repair endonuclease